VFQQDPEMFRLLVYMPKLKEGDTTPDPQTWCNGFVEAMVFGIKFSGFIAWWMWRTFTWLNFQAWLRSCG